MMLTVRLSIFSLLIALTLPARTHASNDKPAPDASKPATTHKKPDSKKQVPPVTSVFQQPYFATHVQPFIDDMVREHHFDRTALEKLFQKVEHNSRAIELVTPVPPTAKRDWQAYRARFIEPMRTRAGVKFMHTYPKTLVRAEKEFGVPREIIAAIIGVETRYGQNTGRFTVLDVLTTLAFSYPEAHNRPQRMSLFREELSQALLYAREAKIDPLALRGSFAGAIGWPQFMPSSIRKYAVDYDKKGKVDLMHSPIDAIGSVANFLKVHGWQKDRPVMYPVTVSDANNGWQLMLNQGLKARYSARDVHAAGVISATQLPDNLQYGLIYLENGESPTEYWLVTDNFYAITQYNRSYFYAMSVVQFGDVLNKAAGRKKKH